MNFNLRKKFFFLLLTPLFFLENVILSKSSLAFPIYAQQGYENPREANGRIVCANCHLAEKPIKLESPSSVLPGQIFNAKLKIPYDSSIKQILGNGSQGSLNAGAILLLPEGFKLNLVKKDLALNSQKPQIYITPYSSQKENILVAGPLSWEQHPEMNFPIISPNPITNKNIFFGKYSLYAGANRGRGQVYPTGEKTNNNSVQALFSGKIETIKNINNSSFEVVIISKEGNRKIQIIPQQLNLIIKEGEDIVRDQYLTLDPNKGGFGQIEKEIVLQSPDRIYTYIAFCFAVILTQSLLVLKKKQFEKVQAAENIFSN